MNGWLPGLLGLVFVGGGYVYYFWARGRGTQAAAPAPAQPERVAAARRNARSLGWWAAVSVVLGVGIFYGRGPARRFWYGRHPPAQEHRQELLKNASQLTQCPPEQLSLVPMGATRVQIEGCGKTYILAWTQPYRRNVTGSSRRSSFTSTGPMQWMPIDPNCTVDYMGCVMPCNDD